MSAPQTRIHDHERLDAPDRLATLERVRSAAQAYVNAPTKFGIRFQAYRSLVKALDAERDAPREAVTHLPRLGTMDDVAALEEIMALAGFEADTLSVANLRLERIFRLASDRLKGDDDA